MVVLLTLLVMVLAFCLIAGFLMALALGIGLLLKACVPTLQLGHAVIAGAVVGPATLYFLRMSRLQFPWTPNWGKTQGTRRRRCPGEQERAQASRRIGI